MPGLHHYAEFEPLRTGAPPPAGTLAALALAPPASEGSADDEPDGAGRRGGDAARRGRGRLGRAGATRLLITAAVLAATVGSALLPVRDQGRERPGQHRPTEPATGHSSTTAPVWPSPSSDSARPVSAELPR